MSIKKIDRREYRCDGCGFIVEVKAGDSPTDRDATGEVVYRVGNKRHPLSNWWLCHDCSRIMDKFLCGDLKLDEGDKQLVLLDDRFNTWWLEYCRMESALKALGHGMDAIKDGTSSLVEQGFRKEDER